MSIKYFFAPSCISFVFTDYSQQSDDEMIITNNDNPSDHTENLRKASEFSLKVSQCDQFLSENRVKTHIQPIILEDTKMWVRILNSYSKNYIDNFFSKCSNFKMSEFMNYFRTNMIEFHDGNEHWKKFEIELETALDLCCESIAGIFGFLNYLTPNPIHQNDDSSPNTLRSLLCSALQNNNLKYQIASHDTSLDSCVDKPSIKNELNNSLAFNQY